MRTYRNPASLRPAEIVPAARSRLLTFAAALDKILPGCDLVGQLMSVQCRVMARHMEPSQAAGYLRDIASHLERKQLDEVDLAGRLNRTG